MRHPIRRLTAVAVACVLAGAGVAVATGRISYVSTNGVSMQPSYRSGDLVVIARSREYQTGQIAAFKSPNGEVVLHRIIGGDRSGYVFKGDNNQSIDPDQPTAGQVLGRAVVHVPRMGGILQSPITRGLLVLGVLIAGLVMTPASRRRADRPTTATTTPRSRLLVPLLAADVILLGALSLSFTTSAGTTTPAKPKGLNQTATLRYHAGIAPSDTYPLGTVDTGDPVYLRLLKAVDVTFAFTTDARLDTVTGTGRMDVDVSSVDGWRTTLPLAPPAPLIAGRLDLTGTLDVAPIQAMAANVAKATGINTTTLDVSVVASVAVSVDGATPVNVSTPVPFKLSPLALTLSGAKPTPSAEGPAVVSTTPLGPAAAAPAAATGAGSRNLRVGLAVALLLALAGTALVWPSGEGTTAADPESAPKHTRAVRVALPATIAQVEVADRGALEDLAERLGCPYIEGSDGWEGVVTRDVAYWSRTVPPAPDSDTAAHSRPGTPGTVALPARQRGRRYRRWSHLSGA